MHLYLTYIHIYIWLLLLWFEKKTIFFVVVSQINIHYNSWIARLVAVLLLFRLIISLFLCLFVFSSDLTLVVFWREEWKKEYVYKYIKICIQSSYVWCFLSRCMNIDYFFLFLSFSCFSLSVWILLDALIELLLLLLLFINETRNEKWSPII